jgi:hypothetical protein
VEEKGFTGGKPTVSGIVATLKDKQKKVLIPLSYEPGEAIRTDIEGKILSEILLTIVGETSIP